jgi:hypothetical protein
VASTTRQGSLDGLNTPVAMTCRTDVMSEVHFDTRQFNHIARANPADFGTN